MQNKRKNNVRATMFIAGMFVIMLTVFMSIPTVVNIVTNSPDQYGFIISTAITAIVGLTCIINGKMQPIKRSDAAFLTCFVWVIITVLAAQPFVFAKTTRLPLTEALFEAMSGLTTTGATILSNLQTRSAGVLLWRAMLNAIGGLGVITLGIFMLPQLKVGLYRVYDTEASFRRYRFGVFRTVIAIMSIYGALMVLCVVAYIVAGMGAFDAICHAFTTVSTGGFSNYDDSIRHFDSASIEIVAIVFMVLASFPFIVYLKLIFDGKFFDEQTRWFIVIVCVVAILGCISMYRHEDSTGSHDGFIRHAVFTLVSLITSTGYANYDYSNWGFGAVVGTIVTLIGGCAGSTNSGIKVYRVRILCQTIWEHIHNITQVSQGIRVPKKEKCETKSAVVVFFVMYMGVLGVFCIVVAMLEGDIATVTTAVTSTLSNTGIGVGNIVGPQGNYAGLGQYTKVLLILTMFLGRLEIVPVFVFIATGLRNGMCLVQEGLRCMKKLDMLR